MQQLVVEATIEKVLPDGRHRTSSTMRLGDSNPTAYFETDPSVPFVEWATGDIWLPPALVIAMARGQDLVIEDPISPDRLDELTLVQDILTTWYPDRLRRAKIDAPLAEPRMATAPRSRRERRRSTTTAPPSLGTASCFTGGVDSFYSVMKNRNRLDALVYGFGIDVPLTERTATERVAELLARVGNDLDLPVLSTQTNIRRIFGASVSWGFYGHGAALASLATVFSPVIDHILIPATHTYTATFPWGSHPLLDRHWSTARLAITHDGAEASRCMKTAAIAEFGVVQRNLRVCYAEFDELNCGRCMKCMRTMAALVLLGREGEFTTFARPLDHEAFAAIELVTDNDRFQFEDIQRLAATVDGHDDIKSMIADIVARHDERLEAGQGVWRPGDSR